MYIEKGNFYAVHDNYLKALEYDPDSFEAYHGLALVYGDLCAKKDHHCVNALKLIEKIRIKFPENDLSDLRELEYQIRQKLGIE